jgi:hypothetical protein
MWYGDLLGDRAMKLSDFSLFSSELILFTCDNLSDGWLKGESVQVQAHGD